MKDPITTIKAALKVLPRFSGIFTTEMMVQTDNELYTVWCHDSETFDVYDSEMDPVFNGSLKAVARFLDKGIQTVWVGNTCHYEKPTITVSKNKGNFDWYDVEVTYQNPKKKWYTPKEEVIHSYEGRDFLFGTSEQGISSYGVIRHNDPLHWDKDYRWSSNAATFNTLLGKHLLEVSVNGFSRAMDIFEIAELVDICDLEEKYGVKLCKVVQGKLTSYRFMDETQIQNFCSGELTLICL